MVLPWFIAVQHKNPTFFREFFIEHNLERFGTNKYQHQQPFWYYLVVVVLALMPWTVLAIRALANGVRVSIREWRLRHTLGCKSGQSKPGDAFPEFLVIWAIIPIIFFSFSQSKLPGYILPALPPITILTGDYLYRRRPSGLPQWLLVCHAALVGVLTAATLLLPWFVAHGRNMPPLPAVLATLVAAMGAAALVLIVVKGYGLKRLRLATTGVLIVLMLFLYGVGPFWFIPGISATQHVVELIDRTYSARPLAEKLETVIPDNETVAVFHVRRDIEYGLSYYRNHEVINYEMDGVPDEEHLLVVRMTGTPSIS
jgi:4-amino-4-deoxy-L-arabinose transferase-like glycosyltransferase